MSKGVKFEYPYFVTNHAIEAFQEKIYNLRPDEIIVLIQYWLQRVRNKPIEIFKKDGKLNATYRVDFGEKPVYIPVVANPGREWPAVPTVYGEESKLHGKYIKGELNHGRKRKAT